MNYILIPIFQHAFDSAGRKYDGHGSLTDWWTNATSAKFEEKTKCFINQYNNFTVTGPNNVTLNVNGLLTLGENLADNGGTTASLAAFRKLGKQEQALPGLENMSSEALFFINLGRIWCGKERGEIALQSVNMQCFVILMYVFTNYNYIDLY